MMQSSAIKDLALSEHSKLIFCSVCIFVLLVYAQLSQRLWTHTLNLTIIQTARWQVLLLCITLLYSNLIIIDVFIDELSEYFHQLKRSDHTKLMKRAKIG